MPNLIAGHYYNEEAAGLVRDLGLPDGMYEQAFDLVKTRDFNIPRHFFDPHANIHLKGVFSKMIGRDDATIDDVTVNEVRDIVNMTALNGNRFEVNGEDIDESNYKSILGLLGASMSKSLSGDREGPVMGLVDNEGNPLTVTTDVFKGAAPVRGDRPKRPNIFKRLLNKMFGSYRVEFEEYDRNKEFYDKYDERLAAYNERCAAIDERFDDNYGASVNFSELVKGQMNELNVEEKRNEINNHIDKPISAARLMEEAGINVNVQTNEKPNAKDKTVEKQLSMGGNH
ncbi:MAG: hypothetical protein E7485_04770 [Ruminococcaceae bacterium]|nr:hypothetical protein [Oscillospiraceae bacterium]